MEIHLTPDVEIRLEEMAQHRGVSIDAVVADAVMTLYEDDEAYRRAVLEGIAQAEAGRLIDEDEMAARLSAMTQD